MQYLARKKDRKGNQSGRSFTPARHNVTGNEATEGTRNNNNKTGALARNIHTGEGGVLTATDQDSPVPPPSLPIDTGERGDTTFDYDGPVPPPLIPRDPDEDDRDY